MGRKGKKIQQDDWESEVDAIAQENAESAYDGVALESLFAKLLAAGVVSESDYDRATDELASGVKSERQLMLEWEKKTCRKDEAATADQQAVRILRWTSANNAALQLAHALRMLRLAYRSSPSPTGRTGFQRESQR